MPTYLFKNPKNGNVFEVVRPMSECDKNYFDSDGTLCEKVISGFTIVNKNQEVFELDESYTRLTNPKYVKFRDGHKEKYDPTIHISGAGKNSDNSRVDHVSLPKIGRPNQKIFKSGIWWKWDDELYTWKQE